MRKLRDLIIVFFVAVAVLIGSSIMGFYGDAFAAWSNDPWVNTPITKTGVQAQPRIVSDGSGGSIFVWMMNSDGNASADDIHSGNWDIYAQRIDANGNILWPTNGVAISTAEGLQGDPQIVSDAQPVLLSHGQFGTIIETSMPSE